jgi:UMF1 family MFS transporter
VVSFLSPAAFGLMIGLGVVVTGKENTQYWGILASWWFCSRACS